MTTKIIIAIIVLAALVAAWMYFSGGAAPQGGLPAGESQTSTLPPASGSLDDLQGAVDADVSQTSSLTGGDDSAAAAGVGASSVTNVSGAASGSY